MSASWATSDIAASVDGCKNNTSRWLEKVRHADALLAALVAKECEALASERWDTPLRKAPGNCELLGSPTFCQAIDLIDFGQLVSGHHYPP